VSHRIGDAAEAAGVDFDIKSGRHYTASQLPAAGFDRRNTAARLGDSGGGATTLRHYAGPVPEADRRAARYLSRLTSNAVAAAETRRQGRAAWRGMRQVTGRGVTVPGLQADSMTLNNRSVSQDDVRPDVLINPGARQPVR